jgi:hypothetical protein
VQLADVAAFADGVAERLIPANYRVDAVPRIVRSSPAWRRSSRSVHRSPMPVAAATRLNIFRTLAASSAAPWQVVNTSPVSCQSSPAANGSLAWLSDQACSAWTAAAGRPRVRRDRPVLLSPWAVEVDVGPAQGPGFFGADPGQQAEHYVGVHELGGAADVFEAGP